MHIPALDAYRIAIVLVLLICMAGATRPNAQAAPTQFRVYLALVNRAAQSSIEQQVIDLTNQQRLQHGCTTALVLSPQLAAAASEHSQDMALRDLFSHTGSDGSTMVVTAPPTTAAAPTCTGGNVPPALQVAATVDVTVTDATTTCTVTASGAFQYTLPCVATGP